MQKRVLFQSHIEHSRGAHERFCGPAAFINPEWLIRCNLGKNQPCKRRQQAEDSRPPANSSHHHIGYQQAVGKPYQLELVLPRLLLQQMLPQPPVLARRVRKLRSAGKASPRVLPSKEPNNSMRFLQPSGLRLPFQHHCHCRLLRQGAAWIDRAAGQEVLAHCKQRTAGPVCRLEMQHPKDLRPCCKGRVSQLLGVSAGLLLLA
jgi:hypothetical protein